MNFTNSLFIIFTVDVETGLNSMDNEISKLLHKSGKQVVLAVNKVDNSKRIIDTSEFFKLGFENTFNISAINGSGTGELLDKIVQFIPDKKNIDNDNLPGFAVVGRPNAGKSSFINALLDEERYVVTETAGTTRDSNNTRYNRFGFDFNLIDTVQANEVDIIDKDWVIKSAIITKDNISQKENTS